MTASAAKQPAILEVPLSELVPSPFNARKHFDRDQLAELAGSIRSEGIIQPLLVRIVDGKYQIIAGERRFRAAKLADLDRVPCIIRESDEVDARRKQIIENLQREGIGPLEEAQAFQDLLKAKGDQGFETESAAIDQHGKPKYNSKGDLVGSEFKARPTVEVLAKELGKSKEYVYARLKLLKLSEPAKKALEAGKIDAGHAVELVPLDEAKQEKALAYIREIASDGETVSVRALRDEIRYSINPPPASKKSAADQAREKRFRDHQAKQQKSWEAENQRRQKEQATSRLVDARVRVALWQALNNKATVAKNESRFADWVIESAMDSLESIDVALLVSQGKAVPDVVNVSEVKRNKQLASMNRQERLAVAVLSLGIEPNWRGLESISSEILAWAKIDRKKIAAAIKAETKVAAAKTLLNRPLTEQLVSEAAEARRVLSTSAKAATKATAKGKSRGKAKRKS